MSGWKRSVLREQVLRVKFFRDYQRERTDNFKESINQQIRKQRWLNCLNLEKTSDFVHHFHLISSFLLICLFRSAASNQNSKT